MGASEAVLNLVRDFRRALESRLGQVDHVVLFGSQARGDAHEDSDVDVIVVSPAFIGIDPLTRAAEASRVWPPHVPVDIVCYTPDEFARLRSRFSLVSEALREGTEVEA